MAFFIASPMTGSTMLIIQLVSKYHPRSFILTYSQHALFKDSSSRIPPDWPYEKAQLNDLLASSYKCEVFSKAEPDAAVFDVNLRFLNEGDFGVLLALHHKILSHLPKREIFRADEDGFIQAHLERRGRTVGAFIGDCLIAYAVVSFPKGDKDNLAEFAGLNAKDSLKVAHFDGAGVDPDYRGSQLHRTMNTIRARYAALAGYDHMMGTVSPLNPYSLMNHLAAGFHVVNFTKRYGGMDRLIIYRKGLTYTPMPFKHQHLINLVERDAIKQALKDGYIGVEVVKNKDKYHLSMGL